MDLKLCKIFAKLNLPYTINRAQKNYNNLSSVFKTIITDRSPN